MSEISPIGRPDATNIQNQRRPQAPAASNGQPAQQAQDQVQLSDHARLLAKLRDLPEREELVNRVRTELQNGAYETDAKLEQALDELGRDIAE